MTDRDAGRARGELRPLGCWRPQSMEPAFGAEALADHVRRFRDVAHVVAHPETGHLGVAGGGELRPGDYAVGDSGYYWMASLPPLYPEWLGDRAFCEVHGVRFPYVAGAMARGIASPELVIAMARAQMMSFLGTAGLSPRRVTQQLDTIEAALGDRDLSWGANLIHSPNEPQVERQLVDLYIERGVDQVSASAFMKLTPPLVRYACTGLSSDEQGRIRRPHKVIAKVSRAEVARRFMEPAPESMVRELVRQGHLSETEARLAAEVPVAQDITAEADSGGHTDGRPLSALLPAMTDLAAQVAADRGYASSIRVGAAGGIGTPTAAAGAFALGAAYIVTGSINQCTVEAGVARDARKMLAGAEPTDVAVAPSADMFEIGAEVQVLSRGTMFASRANRLGKIYRDYQSLAQIPEAERTRLETQIFRDSIDNIWAQTRRFWLEIDRAEVTRAEENPHHKMALVFRWYLGKSSRWPIEGTEDRRLDYQLWCGPSMGAFNAWVRGTHLEDIERRGVVPIAHNILEGAAKITRAQQLRSYGIHLPAGAFRFEPRPLK